MKSIKDSGSFIEWIGEMSEAVSKHGLWKIIKGAIALAFAILILNLALNPEIIFDKFTQYTEQIKKENVEYRKTVDPIIRDELKDLVLLDYDAKIVCSTKENKKTIKNMLQNSTNCDKIIIVVGPEGGLDLSEEEFLKENGFESITLGKTTLRVETAPMFVMSAIKYENLRWQKWIELIQFFICILVWIRVVKYCCF